MLSLSFSIVCIVHAKSHSKIIPLYMTSDLQPHQKLPFKSTKQQWQKTHLRPWFQDIPAGFLPNSPKKSYAVTAVWLLFITSSLITTHKTAKTLGNESQNLFPVLLLLTWLIFKSLLYNLHRTDQSHHNKLFINSWHSCPACPLQPLSFPNSQK